jgi:integrase
MTIRAVHRLSPAFVMKTKKPGLHADGGNLLLQITLGPAGNVRRSWIFRFQLPGRKVRDMGLGNTATVSLAEAREVARDNRKLLAEGLDPIAVRDAKVAANLAKDAAVMTFDEAARQYIAAHRSSWRSVVHLKQWETSIRDDASPVIGKLDVAQITTAHVMRVLQSIWEKKNETARRLRGRIESVLDWATARGYRQGDNPARWKGHLQNLLARPSTAQEHLRALAYSNVPGFMAELRQREGIAALALEFAILTAARMGEVTGARFDEINWNDKVWTIPAGRMKGNREHRVPLPARAMAVISKARDEWGSKDHIFADPISGKPVAPKVVRRVAAQISAETTVHGFRSSFRDWGGDKTAFAREVVESALAHKTGDAVEQAYRRSDALEKRRKLMEAWSAFCSAPVLEGAKVVSIR